LSKQTHAVTYADYACILFNGIEKIWRGYKKRRSRSTELIGQLHMP
jgi:hypothetical protein